MVIMSLNKLTFEKSCTNATKLQGDPKKKTGDFSQQPQIVSGRIIYQNVGNFLEIMCAKFDGIRCYRRLAVPEKLPKIGPKSRFTSGLSPEARIRRRKKRLGVPNSLTLCVSVPKNRSPITQVNEK